MYTTVIIRARSHLLHISSRMQSLIVVITALTIHYILISLPVFMLIPNACDYLYLYACN